MSDHTYSSLARDLEKDHKTIRNWLTLLENLYIVFPVRRWHKNIARAILKEPKYYFYDTGQVLADEGIRLENLVATALHKELHSLEDVHGMETSLHFIRTKEKKELDFAVQVDNQITHIFEVKLSDGSLSQNFSLLQKHYMETQKNSACKKSPAGKNISRWRRSPPGGQLSGESEFERIKRNAAVTAASVRPVIMRNLYHSRLNIFR